MPFLKKYAEMNTQKIEIENQKVTVCLPAMPNNHKENPIATQHALKVKEWIKPKPFSLPHSHAAVMIRIKPKPANHSG